MNSHSTGLAESLIHYSWAVPPWGYMRCQVAPGISTHRLPLRHPSSHLHGSFKLCLGSRSLLEGHLWPCLPRCASGRVTNPPALSGTVLVLAVKAPHVSGTPSLLANSDPRSGHSPLESCHCSMFCLKKKQSWTPGQDPQISSPTSFPSAGESHFLIRGWRKTCTHTCCSQTRVMLGNPFLHLLHW